MNQPLAESNISAQQQDIVLYQSQDGEVELHVNVFDESVWITQKHMGELFRATVPNISMHLKNCYSEGEIAEESTIKKFLIVQKEGGRQIERHISHYNLDAILSVGYRVKSSRATQFRQWATQVLKQYTLQGGAFNEERVLALMESSNQKAKEEMIATMERMFMRLADRPINISINNQIGSPKLEDKLIDLIDEVISSIKSDTVKHQLEDIKQDIQASPTSSSAKQRVSNFFKEIGDTNSSTHKAIKGAGITKGIIAEIIKLGSKLKDLV